MRLIGKIQAAGINEEGHFLELLDQILVELDKGSAELQELSAGIVGLQRHLPALDGAATALRASIEDCSSPATAAA